ncbi:MAG: substrate-binding domain-containing protein [Oscillospiraceae bacterium]
MFGRDSASGTRSAFEEILGIQDKCAYLNEYSSTGDVIGNVASNPNAIGYACLSAVDDTVSAVSVDGVAPTEATVADGSFPIQRPFVIVTVEGTELSEPAAQAFLDYAMSADVADIIAAAGAVSANG